MLKRIEQVKGVGLFHDANGNAQGFGKCTLIFGENGRGKSTLSAILRSCQANDPSPVIEKSTIDSEQEPSITIQFDNGHKVTFHDGKWSEKRPEMIVFDAAFVDRNIHSGPTIGAEQRRALLEFALGEDAVKLRRTVNEATESAKKQREVVSGIENRIAVLCPGTSLTEFESLSPVEGADGKLKSLQKRINATEIASRLKLKELPEEIAVPQIDLEGFNSVLQETLDDIHEEAESLVQAHVSAHGGEGIEDWISRGIPFQHHDTCPFCGQGTQGLKLLDAYKGYFNQKYKALKQKVDSLRTGIDKRLPEDLVSRSMAALELANSKLKGWEDHVEAAPVTFDKDSAESSLQELRSLLHTLARKKQSKPLDVVGSEEEKLQQESVFSELLGPWKTVNERIRTVRKRIEDFNDNLSVEALADLKSEVRQLELAKLRSSEQVKNLFKELDEGREKVKALEKKKAEAKDELNKLMSTLLDQYRDSINALLKKFGASFQIKKFSADYKGGGKPRSEYALELRGQEVSLGGGPPDFSSTLSEGDKRALAFAFFAAKAMNDPRLGEKVLIIDDPMCSLDRYRRRQTRGVLQDFARNSEQLILMAHDPFFLSDFRRDVIRAGLGPVNTLQLKRVALGYSDFDSLDLQQVCESDYFRHCRIVDRFVKGESVSSVREVAKAIRPMLEGYLHRRFPGLVNRDRLFGEIVNQIKDALPGEPLAEAQDIVGELNEINSYAGEFHHDSNPSADTVPVDESELFAYATRAIKLIHRGRV